MTSAWPMTELVDQGIQTEEIDVPLWATDPDDEHNLSLEIERRTLQGMIAHKVEVLKLASQAVHHTFLALQQSEK